MKRVGKIFLGIVIVLAVLLVVALFFLGPVIKGLANTVGSQLLGVPVEIKDASVRPLSGTVRLSGVRIGNPEGYSESPLFSLAEMRFALDLSSLRGNGPIVIKELAIIEPQVAYEVKGGKSNIETLTMGLPQGDKDKKDDDKKKAKAEKGEGRKVVIDLLEFRGGKLSYRAKMTLGKAITLPLPGLTLKEIGREKEGVSTTEAIGKVLGELLNVVGGVVANIGTAAIDVGKGAVEVGATVVGAGADAIGSAASSIGSAAVGLFDAVTGGGSDDEADDAAKEEADKGEKKTDGKGD